MSSEQLEVYRQHRSGQERYVYFLLAAAGAAIALAINQTQDAKLGWPQIPLAFAVTCWALSFYFGCRHLRYVESVIYDNAEVLKIQSGSHPQVGRDVQLGEIALGIVKDDLERNAKRAKTFARLQFNGLLLGAAWYIGWHVYEMYLRTVAVHVAG